jgi:GNAT superfamily N-acetyltransferase
MRLEIRRIRPDEGLRLRTFRLYSLADAPSAFGSTLAEEMAYPESLWHERARSCAAGGDRVIFVAEQNGQWVGSATGLTPDPGSSHRSGLMLVAMFVDGTVRRRGVGDALVASIVGWARAREATRLTLWVTSTNEAAIALYGRSGFRPTGSTRPGAHDLIPVEVEMVHELT